jgi:hypothetical protein
MDYKEWKEFERIKDNKFEVGFQEWLEGKCLVR